MENIQVTLNKKIAGLSDKNYEQSLAFFRLWFEIAHTHSTISPDAVLGALRTFRTTSFSESDPINPTAHLILRFAGDAESDHILAPHCVELRRRLCAETLRRFFDTDLGYVYCNRCDWERFHADVNLVAHCINSGYVEEAVIRNHILQSLISHPTLLNYQAYALIILFKLAGATFGAYADPSVIDRCFELLVGHYAHVSGKGRLIQELVKLRERDWEGLHLPPVLNIGKLKQTVASQNDPAATPVVTSLGLPNSDLEPHTPQPPPPGPTVTPETDTAPRPPTTHSPSISISTLSDLTIADTSDDESPLDSTVITPHDTFYLDDGNVEVLCGNTLFRVQASAVSFHSPVLSQMLAKSNLATAESPNGCPRIVSSDTAADFSTLLKVIYLPEFPERNKVPDFTTSSSLLRMTTKYEMLTVRSQILEVILGAYPETFEGLDPSKALGESVFSGPTPHPNAVLNLFVQQKLASALPMAYYMAVRRGPESLMGRRLPASARLPPDTLQATIQGLFTLREMELKETHRLIFGSKGSRFCSRPNCPSRNATGPGISEAHQKVVDQIVDSIHSGTKVLQVPSLRKFCGGDSLGFCEECVGGWESGHADVRKKAWAALPDVFGLKG